MKLKISDSEAIYVNTKSLSRYIFDRTYCYQITGDLDMAAIANITEKLYNYARDYGINSFKYTKEFREKWKDYNNEKELNIAPDQYKKCIERTIYLRNKILSKIKKVFKENGIVDLGSRNLLLS